MGRIILITGGCRSGKSRFAQQSAEALSGPRAYVATYPPDSGDHEMGSRIIRHQADRQNRGWTTIEEPLDLAGLCEGAAAEVLLIDCLSLWVSNLMWDAEKNKTILNEDDITHLAGAVGQAASARDGTTFFVTNEVGLGVVPEHASGRRFRDLLGRCNQTLAAVADEVYLVVCGIPMTIKGEGL